ncbi:MAG TPA: FUSC family protein [Solirubrobacteraceae bacterium]|nr:FUSC family protein [Solirubrobacteraceae bacterium]
MAAASTPPSTLSTAARDAFQFNRSALSPVAGLLAAIPIVGLLGGLVAVGQPVEGVTAAVGAMFVGIAWRINGGRPPLAVMATDALMMALATLAGCLTGQIVWLHVVVLAAFSLSAGLLAGIGRSAGIVGFQSLLAVIVFGRFTEPLGPAAGIAGLVAAGGLIQMAFQALVRWPPPLLVQRRATAKAYRELAQLALGDAQTPAAPAAEALDEAGTMLSGGTLFGSSAIAPLRSLINEGRRVRIAISALNGLAARFADSPEARDAVHAIAADTYLALRDAAGTIEHQPAAAADLASRVLAVSAAAARLGRDPSPGEVSPAVWTVTTRRLAALAGQLRAIAGLAAAAAAGSGLRARRPYRRTAHPLGQLRSDLAALRASVSRDSPAARHAVRLAIIVPGTGLLTRALPVDRSYWVVIAAAATIRPEFGATFTRGIERVGGTALGVTVAGIAAALLHPSQPVTIALVGVFGWAAMTVFAASYALGFTCITALVVFLLNTLALDTTQVATARLIDTLIGGAIGLAVFALWPTWARRPAQELLSELADAQRRYVGLVLGALVEGTPLPAQVGAASREARLARTRAASAVGRSLSEPARHRIDARVGSGVLDEMLRLVHAIHTLRLEAHDDRERAPQPALAPFARALDVQLAAVARALRSDDLQLSSEYVDLRELADRYADRAGPDRSELSTVIDEIADATNAIDELVAPE